MLKHFLLLIIILNCSEVFSQNLKLEEIMKGNEFIGHQPENPRWSFDGSMVLFDWNPENEPGNSTYYWKSGMEQPEKYIFTDYTVPVQYLEAQKAYDTVYFVEQGAIFSFIKSKSETKKVYHTSFPVYNLVRGVNPDEIFFQQSTNIWKLNIKESSLIQLTNFKKSKETDKPVEENFLTRQQTELFDYIRDTDVKKKWQTEQTNEKKLSLPKEYIYGPENIQRMAISPDGFHIVFVKSKTIESTPTKVEHFITKSGFTENISARAKVSVKNIENATLGVFSAAKDSVFFIDFSDMPGIKDHPAYFKDYDHLKNKEKAVKLIGFNSMIFNRIGSELVVDVRSGDNKDRWLVQIDIPSGKTKVIDHQYDEAWIGGPGIGWGWGTLGFLPDNETVYYQSERTGYSHLYLYNLRTNEMKQLTNGNWEVRSARLSEDGMTFYLSTNTTHPGNRSFYKLDIASGQMTGIFTEEGAFEVVLSPDEKKLLVKHSNSSKPWELFIAENTENPVLEKITRSTTEAFDSYRWRKPDVITFKATDGAQVYARVYTPDDSVKNGAGVIFVHGAGYLQNAHNFWSDYYREYMFHNLLTDKGYTVMDIDYRGSDGYGRDVRTGIYRYMGGLDLSDQIDGKKYMVDKLGVDNERVGMYGGSYGGFITLMALLTKPGTFKAGAALRSVTDWAHYNHGYTSNILNFPETDSIAYRRSSPIYFAENLQDRLIMLHGMVDDNVQFQDVVRLSQRFIEKGIKGWELAVYPVEAHGFKETYSWVDEYGRILQLFEDTIGKR
ncbi:MAG: S9 family peptidase [Saprospiraceae bacterium]|nr:S9 family peptidase [Saprospiraceae bacterium]